MSLDMFLEFEGANPDWPALSIAAQKIGVADFQMIPERAFNGYFVNSQMPFWLAELAAKGRPVMAEGSHGCSFSTRCTVGFRMNLKLFDESSRDLHDFVSELSKISRMQFVLSFQMEEVHARNCDGTFEYLQYSGR